MKPAKPPVPLYVSNHPRETAVILQTGLDLMWRDKGLENDLYERVYQLHDHSRHTAIRIVGILAEMGRNFGPVIAERIDPVLADLHRDLSLPSIEMPPRNRTSLEIVRHGFEQAKDGRQDFSSVRNVPSLHQRAHELIVIATFSGQDETGQDMQAARAALNYRPARVIDLPRVCPSFGGQPTIRG